MNNLIPVSDIQAMAQAVVASKLFGISTPEQAMSLMLIAQAEGMHPAIAARDYHIIQGRPSLKADAMLARFQNAGGKVRWGTYTDDKVSGTFSHPSGGDVTIEWDMKRAKLCGLDGKDNWKKYPRQMLRARTISEGVRTVCPGVTAGLYTPEEIQDAPQERDMGVADRVETGPVYITEDQAIELRTLIDGNGLSIADFCKAGNCETLDKLLVENYEGAKKWVSWAKAKKDKAAQEQPA
jgi:hypothetical protein